MENKKTIFLFVVFILMALAIGFFVGNWQGKLNATQQLKPILDVAFPEPPSDIASFTGAIKGVSGATIAFQISDPDDYLPHLDGAPRKTQIRFATVTPTTKITSVDGKTGNTRAITLQDLKIGDFITAVSNQNIRNADRFDATEVRIVR